MRRANSSDFDVNIAIARTLLSVLALTSWYVDPANGGWFFIDRSSLIILLMHLVYSSAIFMLVCYGIAMPVLPGICTVLDVAFAALITAVTEGSTSPSWLFFVFAILEVNSRTSFRAAITVTMGSALIYFALLVAFIPGPRNEYLMRSAYLAIIGYLIGFIGTERVRSEARVRELEAASARHAIACTLHDSFVQALAGANLQLESCRVLMQAQRGTEAMEQIADLQKALAREYDEVRAYIRSLADVEQCPEYTDRSFAVETVFELTAKVIGRASLIEQILQIVLEGVRNTWRHGRATSAAINISAADRLIRIAIDDDGIGFPDSGHPPWAIASRVAQYGGRLTIGGGERRGAHLQIEIPAT